LAIHVRKGPRGTKYVADCWLEGKRRRKFFDTKKDAADWVAEQRVNIRKGRYVDDTAWTFADAAQAYTESRADRRPTTRSNINSHLKHILPQWGNLPIARITVSQWEGLRRELLTRLKPSSVSSIQVTVGAVFKHAIRLSRCERNPVASAERLYTAAMPLPEWDASADGAVLPASIPTTQQIAEIADKLPMPYSLVVEFAAGTGMRRGEILALLWPSIDLQKRRVTVSRGLSWALGRVDPYPPKTRSAVRTVSLSADLCGKLEAYKLHDVSSGRGLVFSAPNELPLASNAVSHALIAAGVRLKLHSLRHHAASRWLARGLSIAQVSRLLGHANVAITARIYLHCLPDTDWTLLEEKSP
jgi:integrase